MAISTLTIHSNIHTTLQRCIDEVIILFPLSYHCSITRNGKHYNIHSGIIINNSDLYQIHDSRDLVELRIPLTWFVKRFDDISHSYFDFAQIQSPFELKSLILQNVAPKFMNKTIETSNILKIIDFLIKEARIPLTQVYMPVIKTEKPLIRKLLAFTNQHIYENISTSDLSNHFFISQSYISILFSKHLGMNYKDYVASLRISLSLLDLTQNSLMLNEVFHKFSYTNMATFTKQFQRYLYQTPRQYTMDYRALHLKNQGDLQILPFDYAAYHEDIQKLQSQLNEVEVRSLHLKNLKEVHAIPPIETYIHVDYLADLVKYTHQYFDHIELKRFAVPNLLIRHLTESDFEELHSYYALIVLKELIDNGCHVTFQLDSIALYHRCEQFLSKLLDAGTITTQHFASLTLLFNSAQTPLNDIALIRRSAQSKLPSIRFAYIIDHYLTETKLSDYTLESLKSVGIDFYFIESDLITFNQYLCVNAEQYHTTSSIKDNIQKFIKQFGTEAKQLVFNQMTHSGIRAYYESHCHLINVHLTQFIIEISQHIGGLGYPIQSEDKDQITLLNHHLCKMPVVHIYQLLRQFIGYQVMLTPFGIVSKRDNQYHLLLFGATEYNDEQRVSRLVKVYHESQTQTTIFTRLLNQEFGTIENAIPSTMDDVYLNPSIIEALNESNHMSAKIETLKHNGYFEIKLQNHSLHYKTFLHY